MYRPACESQSRLDKRAGGNRDWHWLASQRCAVNRPRTIDNRPINWHNLSRAHLNHITWLQSSNRSPLIITWILNLRLRVIMSRITSSSLARNNQPRSSWQSIQSALHRLARTNQRTLLHMSGQSDQTSDHQSLGPFLEI